MCSDCVICTAPLRVTRTQLTPSTVPAGLHEHLRPADILRGAPAHAAPPQRAVHEAAGVPARQRPVRLAQRLHTGIRVCTTQLRYVSILIHYFIHYHTCV